MPSGVYTRTEKTKLHISEAHKGKQTGKNNNNYKHGLTGTKEYKKSMDNNIKKKQWVGGTRPTHAAIDGQIKDFNDTFDNGLMYPHDPSGEAGEVINCTCALAPII